MSPYAYFIMMDFVRHQFHVYFGDMNDPQSWKWTGNSFANMIDAEDKMIELIHPNCHDHQSRRDRSGGAV